MKIDSTVGSYEAKTHLPQLLDRVCKGEEITITRNGEPLARLVPFRIHPRIDLTQMIAEMETFQENSTRLNPPGEKRLRIKELIDQGRR